MALRLALLAASTCHAAGSATSMLLDGADWMLTKGAGAAPAGASASAAAAAAGTRAGAMPSASVPATVPGGVWDNLHRAGLVGNPLYRDNDLVFYNAVSKAFSLCFAHCFAHCFPCRPPPSSSVQMTMPCGGPSVHQRPCLLPPDHRQPRQLDVQQDIRRRRTRVLRAGKTLPLPCVFPHVFPLLSCLSCCRSLRASRALR